MSEKRGRYKRFKEYKCFMCGKTVISGTMVGTGMVTVSVDRYVDETKPGKYPYSRPERLKSLHLCDRCAERAAGMENAWHDE